VQVVPYDILSSDVPANVVRIMIDWYGKTCSVVKWNNIFSREVCIFVVESDKEVFYHLYFSYRLYYFLINNLWLKMFLGVHI